MAPTTRVLLSLLQLSAVLAAPQHTHGADPNAVATANPDPSAKQPAPAGCKKLPIDSDWPSAQVVDDELRGWEQPMADGKKKHPNFVYEVKTVASTQRAVQFCIKHNVRLSIINSGHDFLGRNDAPSGVLLNVNGLKGVRVLEGFTPSAKGAEPVDSKTVTNVIKIDPAKKYAVTFGAGMSIDELNRELRKSGLYTVGAAHGEVSVAGGWSQAGGHSWLSMEYGLGADNMLEYKLITADGNLTVANAVTNSDLFWALRGGGGGTWGAVVEATMNAYPAPKILSYNFWMNTTNYNDRKSIVAPATYIHTQFPLMAKEGGFQGYLFIHPNAIQAQLICPNKFANATNMRRILDPIIKKMVEMPGMNPKSLISLPPAELNLSALLAGLAKNGAAGKGPKKLTKRHGPGEMMMYSMGIYDQDSRLLGEKELADPRLADIIERAIPYDKPDGQIRVHLTAGGKVNEQRNDTSVHPTWRQALVHNVATGGYTPIADSWRELAPHMGAYVNEAWIGNPDWKETFWGSNYPKLSAIKKKWDPDMHFYVTPGVNADLMVAKGDRLCHVQGEPVANARKSAPYGDNVNGVVYQGDKVTFPVLYAGEGKPPINWNLFGPKAKAKAKEEEATKPQAYPGPNEPKVLPTPKVNPVARSIDHLI